MPRWLFIVLDPKTINHTALLNFIVVMEGVMLLLATGVCYMFNIDLSPYMHINIRDAALGGAVGLLLPVVSTLMYWVAKFPAFKWLGGMRDMTNILAPNFAALSFWQLLLIAASSGFCEEIMFRGILQTQFGLIFASVFFGLAHNPGTKYIQYGIWAMTAGMLFGGLFIYTNSLWTPIIAHFLNNIIGLMILRWLGMKSQTSQV